MSKTDDVGFGAEYCPLTVEKVSFNDPVFVLGGKNWGLSTLNPWRVISGAQIVFSWGHSDAAEKCIDLRDLDVLSFRKIDSNGVEDLLVSFSNGLTLQVFSMGDPEEWVLDLPQDLTIVCQSGG